MEIIELFFNDKIINFAQKNKTQGRLKEIYKGN